MLSSLRRVRRIPCISNKSNETPFSDMDQISIISDVSIAELWELDLDQNGQLTVAVTKSVVVGGEIGEAEQ